MKPSLYKIGDTIQVIVPKRDVTPNQPYRVVKVEPSDHAYPHKRDYCIRDDANEVHWLDENQIRPWDPGSPCDVGATEYEEIMQVQGMLDGTGGTQV